MTDQQHDLGDEIAGRAKEAWGNVTGDERLRQEGRAQHTADDVGVESDAGALDENWDKYGEKGRHEERLDAGADRGAGEVLDGGADQGASDNTLTRERGMDDTI